MTRHDWVMALRAGLCGTLLAGCATAHPRPTTAVSASRDANEDSAYADLSPYNATTTIRLPKQELDAIVRRLSAAYRTTFDVTQSVDPHVIGGVRISMGDRAADGTIAGRLDDIARLLSSN